MTSGGDVINDVDEAYRTVIDAIVTQRLAPSQKVSENILSDTFGISRTIARNLIERLVTQQFLINVSPRVTQVSPLTLIEIKQNFALRKMLLPNVIALCAPRLDYAELIALNSQIDELLPVKNEASGLAILKANRQMNIAMCDGSGYPLMSDWVRQLEDMAMRIYWLYIKIKGSFPYSGEYQRSVFDIMRADDSALTQKAILDMLGQTEERVLNAVFSHEQFYTQDLKV